MVLGIPGIYPRNGLSGTWARVVFSLFFLLQYLMIFWNVARRRCCTTSKKSSSIIFILLQTTMYIKRNNVSSVTKKSVLIIQICGMNVTILKIWVGSNPKTSLTIRKMLQMTDWKAILVNISEESRFIIVLLCESPPKRSYNTIERQSKGPTKRINASTM